MKTEQQEDPFPDDSDWQPGVSVIEIKKKKGKTGKTVGRRTVGKSRCKVCKKVVKKINMHMKTTHPEVKFEEQPKKKRGRKPNLKKFQCSSCDFNANSKNKVIEHAFIEHEEPLTCSECSLMFENVLLFQKHARTHAIPCEICGKHVMEAGMKRHMDYIHSDTADMEPCQVCGKILRKAQLKGHMAKVHTDKILSCPQCPHTSKSSYDLKRHIDRKHTEAKLVNCPWCGRATKEFERHLRNNKCNIPETERTIKVVYACEHCGKEFKTQASLLKHFKTVHEKVKDFHCDQCNYKTTTSYNLRVHVKRVHERRPLKDICPHCDKAVVQLDYHIETYHGELIAYEMKSV